jgi:hypothetical protein
MSQCFSGGFAYLHEAREHKHLPSGHTCGYFSSTPDRPAYGCYPEVRGQKAIGHSFEFLSALARRGRFSAAHADVMVSDDTPDVPLRSSDVYLAEELARAAGPTSHEADFVAALLGQAFAEPSSTTTLRLLARIAAAYGIERPSNLQDLEGQADAIFALLDQVEAHAKVWETALGDFNQANLDQFLASHPTWQERLDERKLRRLDSSAMRSLATSLLSELGKFVTSDAARLAEAERLTTALGANDEISYRSEIRVAALLRMRFVLTSAAGRIWLRGKKEQSKAFEALERCEDLSLPIKTPQPRMAEPSSATALPTVAEDRQRAAENRPGWLGITFVPVNAGRRRRLVLPNGAAQVTSIARHSPAASAGVRTDDIVLGSPGRPFAHQSDLGPYIVSASPGTALPLEVLRGRNRVVLRPTLGEAPVGKNRN